MDPPSEREPLPPRTAEDLLAALPDGVLAFDDERRIVFFNAAAERILGCRAADALGSDVDRFGAAEGVSGQRAAVEHLRDAPGELLFFGEADGIHARRADGTLFLHEGSITRARIAGRAVTIVVFRDVGERRRSNDVLTDVRRQAEYLREEIQSLYNYGELVGRSPALAAMLDEVEHVSGTDATVLLLGETGTGKELVARAIHARSGRRDRPLIKVNCAALSPGLVESELFGHERGAFTGAGERRIGRFELAHLGTIFLDEIGDVPPEVQVKLLRVLQEHEFERVGGTKTLRTDVRVVAATNRDLEARVADRSFREDLYYRLHVFPIRVPPLRERTADVLLLATYFADRVARQLGKAPPRIDAETAARLAAYPWPGNVRELAAVVERAVILSRGDALELGPEALPSGALRSAGAAGDPARPGTLAGSAPSSPARGPSDGPPLPLEEIQRRHVREALEATGWRIGGPGGAAERLGLPEATLRSRMKKLGIVRPT